MGVKLAIFDCDGTLVDSQANIIAAMGEAFGANGLTPPAETATRRVVGLSLLEAMRQLLPGVEGKFHAQLAADYRLAFQRLRGSGAMQAEPLYPGIAEGLAALSEGGWLLGVATGKSDRGLAMALEHHGIAGHFVTLQTADRHPSKPDPAMLHAAMAEAGAAAADTVMIGDTHFDIEMAVAAGVLPIGVDWGYHHPDELRAAGAAHVVGSVAALLAVLAE